MTFTKQHAKENIKMKQFAYQSLIAIGYSYTDELWHHNQSAGQQPYTGRISQELQKRLEKKFSGVSKSRIMSKVAQALRIARGRKLEYTNSRVEYTDYEVE